MATIQGNRRVGLLALAAAMAAVGCGLLIAGATAAALDDRVPAQKDAVSFTDARRQAAEFISYGNSISLTPEQTRVMNEALSTIPAPCCDQFSIATCCCPCNLAKSTWGLSKFLITKQHASAREVNATVSEWLRFTNPGGYTGDACFSGGCNRSFDKNGCGGMDAKHVQ